MSNRKPFNDCAGYVASKKNPLTDIHNVIYIPDLHDILAGQLTDSSIAMYKTSIKQYMAFASANGLDQFNPKTLDAWRDYLAHETNKSPNTINRMLSTIRRLYKEAARRE